MPLSEPSDWLLASPRQRRRGVSIARNGSTTSAEAVQGHAAYRRHNACRRHKRTRFRGTSPGHTSCGADVGANSRRQPVKVSGGTCARALAAACVHEHACVRCSLLRPVSAQRSLLEEIHDNLEAGIIETNRECWLGEVESFQVSYAGVKDKPVVAHRAAPRMWGEVPVRQAGIDRGQNWE